MHTSVLATQRLISGNHDGARNTFRLAVKAYEKVVKLDQYNPNAHDSLGRSYAGAGMYNEATKQVAKLNQLLQNEKANNLWAWIQTRKDFDLEMKLQELD